MAQDEANVGCFEAQLSHVELGIYERLGNTPWTLDRLTPAAITEGRKLLDDVYVAAGFKKGGQWVTTELTNPKLGKSGLPSIGVTLHAAKGAAAVWKAIDETTRCNLAAVFGLDTEAVREVLRVTMCPKAGKCVLDCVTAKSMNALRDDAQVGRLCKTLIVLLAPSSAFALLGDELSKLRNAHGDECRWRVNISDDVRWELLAPGLLEIGVPANAYTKYLPEERPGRPGLSIVYSAHEKMSDDTIRDIVRSGERVAVVFDVPKKKLPETWQGLAVIDGDETDDLWDHDPGVVVGLSAKGRNKEVIVSMRRSGFSRPA